MEQKTESSMKIRVCFLSNTITHGWYVMKSGRNVDTTNEFVDGMSMHGWRCWLVVWQEPKQTRLESQIRFYVSLCLGENRWTTGTHYCGDDDTRFVLNVLPTKLRTTSTGSVLKICKRWVRGWMDEWNSGWKWVFSWWWWWDFMVKEFKHTCVMCQSFIKERAFGDGVVQFEARVGGRDNTPTTGTHV